MLKLKAISGPNRGTVWRIDKGPLLLGRDKSCGVRVPDPLVSRRHCEIVVLGDIVQVNDLGSRNTTLLNGIPIKQSAIRPGDELTLGQITFVLEEESENGPMALRRGGNSTTISLSEGDAVYLAKDSVSRAEESGIHSVTDVMLLFRHTRSFSRTGTLDELLEALERAIIERFEPANFCLALLQEPDGKMHYHPDRPDLDRVFGPAIKRSLEELRGYLISERVTADARRVNRVTMAAPVYFGLYRIGVIAVQGQSPHQAYDEIDLQYLVALAHAAAPFFGAIEQRQQLQREVERLRLAQPESFELIGDSDPMKRVRELVARVAASPHAVLIIGETGTGKELVARQVHLLSDRAQGPLITVNCAAIPSDLIESELFGHEKGSFTGADRKRTGLFELSDGGTLFLDEVGDLSPESQARILRAIETKRFRRVGGKEEIEADFRIVAATNKDIANEQLCPEFRRDLYHRLRGIEIRIPPLRERAEDVPALAQHFLQAARAHAKHPVRGFAPEALETLKERAWLGNVRELQHCIAAAVTFSRGEYITPADLRGIDRQAPMPEICLTLAELEKKHIQETLDQCNGKVLDAARKLGISKTKLYERLSEYRHHG